MTSVIITTILRLVVDVVDARFNNKPLDIGAASLRIYSAARALYEAEVGQPIDESKILPFEPLA